MKTLVVSPAATPGPLQCHVIPCFSQVSEAKPLSLPKKPCAFTSDCTPLNLRREREVRIVWSAGSNFLPQSAARLNFNFACRTFPVGSHRTAHTPYPTRLGPHRPQWPRSTSLVPGVSVSRARAPHTAASVFSALEGGMQSLVRLLYTRRDASGRISRHSTPTSFSQPGALQAITHRWE